MQENHKYIAKLNRDNVDELNRAQKNLCVYVCFVVDYIYRKHSKGYTEQENDNNYKAWLGSPMASTISTPIVNEAECRDFLRQFDENFDTYSRSLVFQNLSGFTTELVAGPYSRNSNELRIFNFHQYINDVKSNGYFNDERNMAAFNELVYFKGVVKSCVKLSDPSI